MGLLRVVWGCLGVFRVVQVGVVWAVSTCDVEHPGSLLLLAVVRDDPRELLFLLPSPRHPPCPLLYTRSLSPSLHSLFTGLSHPNDESYVTAFPEV